MNRTLSGTLLALTSAAGYAMLALWIKWSYHEGLEALDILTWRYIFASILVWSLWPLIRDSAALHTLNRRQVSILIGLGILFVGISLMAVITLERIPATTYTLILYTYPALVAIFSFFLGERLPIAAWLSISLALIGCALTAGGQLDVNKPTDLIFPFGNAASYAVYLIIAGRYTRSISGAASGIINAGGSFGQFVFGVSDGRPNRHSRISHPRFNQWLDCVGLSDRDFNRAAHSDHVRRDRTHRGIQRRDCQHHRAADYHCAGICHSPRKSRCPAIFWRAVNSN